MKRQLASLPLLFVFAGMVLADATPAGGYSFQLDGKPFQPTVFSLNGTPAAPQPGDVIGVHDFLITLGPEKVWHFRSTPRDDGRLLLSRKDGGLQVVAVRVGWTFKGEQKVLINPLDQLSAAEVGELRGLSLDVWTEPIGKRLKHLDPKQTCVVLSDSTAQPPGNRLPALPSTLEYLCIEERSNRGLEDYTRLRELEALRFLIIRAYTAPLDLAHLKRAAGLCYLNLAGSEVRNAGEIAGLKQLRSLSLAHVRNLDSVNFAAGLEALVEFDIQGTKVSDLTPLGGSRSLVTIDANGAPVSKLPAQRLPALRGLKILATQLDEKAARAFADSHPQCQVRFGWVRSLRDELQGVTRLRVRSGGTCHRDIAREQTLAESKDPKEIEQLLANIGIEEQRSGFHCRCCGAPSFEFYKGHQLVLTLGFHHGHGLRWPDGWPGDGALTEASADFLCRWLADRGHRDPLQERQAEQKRAAAARRRTEQYNALIPAAVIERLRAAKSPDAAVKAFQDGIPEEKARAELYLKLFGVGDGSWNQYSGLDDLLKEGLLPAVKKDILSDVIVKLKQGPGLDGACRWLIGEDQWKSLGEQATKQALPVLAAHALGHPRAFNRRQALAMLGQVGSDAALPLLRSMLAAEFKVRSLAAADEVEPGGTVVARPGDLEMTKGSDRAYAALMLAQRRDTASLEPIRKLAGSAVGDDKAVLEKAIELLEKKR